VDLDHLPGDGLVTAPAALRKCRIIFLAVDLVVERVVGSLNDLLAGAARLLSVLEVPVTDRFVLEEKVVSSQLLITDVALHTVGMVEGFIVDHTISDNLLLAHTARLSGRLKAFSTVRCFVFSEEFSLQLLGAALAPEAVLVEDLAEGGAAVLRQRAQATVTIPCRLVDCLGGSIPDFSHNLWIIEINLWRQALRRRCGRSERFSR